MKKIALYVSLALTGLFMAACSEDFKDWAQPQKFSAEDAITIPGFTATPVGAIDLNNAEDQVKVLTLSSSALPKGAEVAHVRFIANDQTINATAADGTFAKNDLQDLIVGLYGPRPEAHFIDAQVYADVMINGQAAFVDAGTVNLSIAPEAPIIEEAYYYVGASNKWSDSDQTYKFDNGGGDVYDNPVFTVTVPAPYNEDGTRADNWFKIAPASAYGNDFWNNLIGVQENGDTSTEGNLVLGNGTEVGAFNQPASDGATMYRISINMMDQTYTITPITFKVEPAYYYVGASNGWSDTDKTYVFTNGGADPFENPVYTCVVPAPFNEDGTRADNWFKIAPESAYTSGNFWGNLFGVANNGDTSTTGELAFGDVGAFNQPASDGALYYRISINPKEMTYEITPLSFNEYIWEAGVNNDWGAIAQPLYCANQDGVYTGFFYAQDADWSGGMGAFKFTGAFNNWNNGNYGTGTINADGLSGTLIDDGGSGNVLVEPGFYRADVNLANMTYSLVRINSIFVVGSAVNNDWDTGVQMTYNIAERCWECTTTLNEGQIKFKGNGTWDSIDGNWGGTLDNIINGSNDNIDVPVTGKVKIKFYPTCDTKSYATITAE
jgi:hypothetical protein